MKAPLENTRHRPAAARRLSFLAGCFVASLCLLLLLYPQAAKNGLLSGLQLCFSSLIPSLLPFMILSDLFLRFFADGKPSRTAAAISYHCLRLPAGCLPVILFSLIGGYPVGAALTCTQLENGQLDRSDAQRMLQFCVCPGPAFVVSAVADGLLHRAMAGWLLYVSVSLSAVFLGLLSRRGGHCFLLTPETDRTPVGISAVTHAVTNSASAMMHICAWVCFISALLGFLDVLAVPERVRLVVCAVCEVTNGCAQAANKVSLPMIAAILGWGGFSTHLQILPYVLKVKLPLRRFLLFRMLNAVVSFVFCAGLLKLFPVTSNVMLQSGVRPVPQQSVSFAVSAVLLMMCLLLLLGGEKVSVSRLQKGRHCDTIPS